MAIINLLPTDLAPKGPTLRIVNYLKQIALVGFVIFLLVTLGLAGYFVITSFELNGSVNRQENLKTQIKSLEQAEQKIILLKDRVIKIKKVLAMPDSQGNIVISQEVLVMATGLVNIGELEISPEETKLTVTSNNSSSLSQFLTTLTGSKVYKTIVLSSFSFNPTAGYSAVFDLFNK
jgi:hypothetical protein